MYNVEIIADSISSVGCRLTTFQLTYPRFIHSEFLTHRMLSRNSQSSRAMPISKLIEAVENHPVIPVHFGANQKGMTADHEIEDVGYARQQWLFAAQDAVRHAKHLMEMGVHKQVVNRLLEPFSTITTIATATEWDHFFSLRCAGDAQPEIQTLACLMKNHYDRSTPKQHLYHLPYIYGDDYNFAIPDIMRISSARCARVSYLTHDGEHDAKRDLALAQRLIDNKHMSPFEHAAHNYASLRMFANFKGWESYRYWMGE